VSKPAAALSDDELRQIRALLEALEGSTFDFLQVEIGDLKLTVGKGALPSAEARSAKVKDAVRAPAAQADGKRVPAEPDRPRADAVTSGHAITAPMVGRFYARPQPGAKPFVTVGSKVDETTTVCLIEVMKVFNGIHAETHGVVSEVCVEDGDFVEYGQVLFRVRQD